MKLNKHLHLDAESLLHLLRLLGIRSTLKPLINVGLSSTSYRYFYNGRLFYRSNKNKMEYLT